MTEEQLIKLERINNLRKDGVISEAEFRKQKKDILVDNRFDTSNAPLREAGSVLSRSDNSKFYIWLIVFVGVFVGFIAVNSSNNLESKNKEYKNDKSSAIDIKEPAPINDSTLAIEGEKLRKEAKENIGKYFTIKKDEFNSTSWVMPKTAPSYRNSNAIFLYFEKKGDKVWNLRFVTQYSAEDWLFIQSIQFLIDDVNYDYTPNHMQTDNGGGDIWEWFDDPVNSSNMVIISALAKAKKAKIRFLGRQYSKIRVMTPSQLKSISTTFKTYIGLGGTF